MTKSELINRLASRFPNLSVRDADTAVKLILETMTSNLVEGCHRIEIRGFGSFSLSQRAPRIGRNPKSGETVEVPAKRVPHFKPGKELRERVNQSAQTTPLLNASDDLEDRVNGEVSQEAA